MAWIEAHQELPRHPKTKRFARMLKISIPQAVGHLFMFWWWALDYAENGDLSRYDADDLADAAQWDGDPQEFLKAMIECGPGGSYGFIEEDESGMSVHDWEMYSGRLVEKREKNRQRQARIRQETSNSEKGLQSENDENKPQKKSRKRNKNVKSVVVIREVNLDDNSSDESNEAVTRDSDVTNGDVARESQGYTTEHNTTETEQNTTATDSPPPPAPEAAAEAEASASEINLGELVRLWNEKLTPLGFSHVLKKTPTREKALQNLLDTSADRKNPLWWQQVLDRVSLSEFLRNSVNERNWFTLDWLLNESNLVKLLEGRYDNRPDSKPAPMQAPVKSIAEIMEQHSKFANAVNADFSVVEEGEIHDGERSPGFQ